MRRARVAIVDAKGRSVSPERVRLQLVPSRKVLVYLVMVETYVEKILNRKELQRHCDEFRTAGGSVDALHWSPPGGAAVC
jgi:hypothetical protein